jgi:hypothetical protein
MKQELAKEYVAKLRDLFIELLQVEKESKIEEREQVYAHNQTRIHRLIENYFRKLKSDD